MQKNEIVTNDQVVKCRKPKTLPNTKHGSKKMNEGQIGPRSNRSKLMALHDALQDPITGREGF